MSLDDIIRKLQEMKVEHGGNCNVEISGFNITSIDVVPTTRIVGKEERRGTRRYA